MRGEGVFRIESYLQRGHYLQRSNNSVWRIGTYGEMAEDAARQGLGHKWIASKQIWVYPIVGEAV